MKTLLIILMSSVLVNNYVLSRFLGICPFLGVSKKLDQATGMGISVTAVMLLATAFTWPIQYFVLDKLGLGYLQTIIFSAQGSWRVPAADHHQLCGAWRCDQQHQRRLYLRGSNGQLPGLWPWILAGNGAVLGSALQNR